MNAQAAAQRVPFAGIAISLLVLTSIPGCSRHDSDAPSKTAAQTTYATPVAAGDALHTAAAAGDAIKLSQVLGPGSVDILNSGDANEDRAALQSFVAKYDRMSRWVTMTDGSQVLYIGADNYPFPIPLTKNASSQWIFDTTAGRDELLARRIGRNELLAIDASTAIANAEEVFYQQSAAGQNHQYTTAILSSPGKHDGLHWETASDEPASPLGKLGDAARSAAAHVAADRAPVFDGYAFRILTAQGSGAKGGAKNYLVDGKLKSGFAVLATPVKYQDSGIMSFLVNRDGVVYQKDLGANTSAIASSISAYDPADSWTPAE